MLTAAVSAEARTSGRFVIKFYPWTRSQPTGGLAPIVCDLFAPRALPRYEVLRLPPHRIQPPSRYHLQCFDRVSARDPLPLHHPSLWPSASQRPDLLRLTRVRSNCVARGRV